jgi:uncharacterized RmlC-like cupin family protein
VCGIARGRAVYRQAGLFLRACSFRRDGGRIGHSYAITHHSTGRAKAHKHEAHETAIYVISGEGGMYYGERLEHLVIARAGDFIYISANVPHLPYNVSQTEPCLAVIARTDPNEQESVVLLPELDALHM